MALGGDGRSAGHDTMDRSKDDDSVADDRTVISAFVLAVFATSVPSNINTFSFAHHELSQNVPGGASVTECFNVNNYHCDFTVKNTAGQAQSISTSICEADMLVTNNGCNGHGGIRVDGNFQLTVDPNAGSC
ncbi:hypothetical protein GALMADRAFT_157759 [Galerina marginata CBS 339.88]|uniref:Glycan binding protein Y3-like domain-containing protein n=1 Tax=Galerina marginata (strain CBS 339.88) TaxID=685588 RepID=A0A067SV51_GALM3|nr:hypothetical protein GALMADRAFT_157759 [Galerina marginata CBS 339.88]